GDFVRRIGADKCRVTIGPAAGTADALYRRLGLNKNHILGKRLRSQGTQGRDVVHDPDAATVRADHQIMIPGMYAQVHDRNVRQFTSLILGPLLAAVERDPEAKLRAQEEQIAIDRVFLNDMRVAANGASFPGERRPVLSKVGRPINIGAHIAIAVKVESDISRTLIKMARIDRGDPRIFGQSLNVGNHVGPNLPAVFGYLNITFVSPRPDNVGVFRRFRD